MNINMAVTDIDTPKKIHLMGIGGAGMSGLALLLNSIGHIVSGCDMENTFYLNRVRQQGIVVSIGHQREHIDTFCPDMIIYTSAIPQDHPELIEAKKRGIAVARRAEVLSEIFNARRGIGVAGTHGKTTTSSMIALIAEHAGLDPTVAIGGELSDIGCNAKLGSGRCMVAELDESDGSFELFSPDLTVVTNVDWDHRDHYPDLSDVIDAFGRFIDARKSGTPFVICGDDRGAMRVLDGGRRSDAVIYGLDEQFEWSASDIRYLMGGGASYELMRRGRREASVSLKLSGEHNILNSLAAIAAADILGVDLASALRSLSVFKGAKRRLQLVGESNGIVVYDDYGHHPREISATLSALANAYPGSKIHVIFQPHRYTRTEAMSDEFAEALSTAGAVYLLPIYSADEPAIPGVSSFLIAEAMEKFSGAVASVCGDFQEVAATVCDAACPGDIVLTIGAGNIEYLSKQILTSLQKRFPLMDANEVVA